MCPVNALLWWLAISKIRRGYIFNPSGFDPEAEIDEEKAISYPNLLHDLKSALGTLIPGLKWGTHTIRKTAILISTWGGGCDTDIAESARCKLNTVSINRKDAATLREMALVNKFPFQHLVDTFRSQLLLNTTMSKDMTRNANAKSFEKFDITV